MATKTVIKCMNENCNNYKQQLNDGVEICSLCGKETVKIETNENTKLSMIAIITALACFVISFGGGWILGFVVQIIALIGVPVAVVLAFLSKSKKAVIITIITLVAGVAVFLANTVFSSY